MSVDTNTKHKNLAAYQKLRHSEYEVYITPVLSGMVSRLRVTTKGKFLKNLTVELSDRGAAGGSNSDPSCC